MTQPSEIKSLYKLLVDPDHPDYWAVRLISPDWDGIVVRYTKMQLKEPKSSKDPLRFAFDTDILFVPERFRGVKFSQQVHVDYTNMLGQILFDIVYDPQNKIREVNGKLCLTATAPLDEGTAECLKKIKREAQ